MIKYSQNPSGGFGNRLFQFNFIAQLAAACNTDYQFRSYIDREISSNCLAIPVRKFEKIYPSIKIEEIASQKYLDVISQINQLLEKKRTVRLSGITLGETFSDFTKVSPRILLDLKLPTVKFYDTTVAIHFRGGDFKDWNAMAILPASYYESAIEFLLASETPPKDFYLVTDDTELESFNTIKRKYANFVRNHTHSGRQLIEDFSLLQNADYLISSPSTFAIWSSILGNHKAVIHSQAWMNSRIEAEDRFWIDLELNKSEFLPRVVVI